MRLKSSILKSLFILAAAAAAAACGEGADPKGVSESAATFPTLPGILDPSTGLPVGLDPSLGLGGTGTPLPSGVPLQNGTGFATTLSTSGDVNSGPFFQSFGTNGRVCGSCHTLNDGWTITPGSLAQRFNASNGTDPVFRPVDGAVCPNADVSTPEARKSAYSLLLNKALIRVGIPVPANGEFELAGAEGTYCNTVGPGELSMYRRPLPATNLKFESSVMWDGRETVPGRGLQGDLGSQAADATKGHAQAAVPLPEGAKAQIVGFELGLSTAQTISNLAGTLDFGGARGGPALLQTLAPPQPGPPPAEVFTIFKAWDPATNPAVLPEQAAIARGEALFNRRPMNLAGVTGSFAVPPTGTCGSCHSAPEVGSGVGPVFLNIGTAAAVARTPDLPLYTLRNKRTGELVQTTDPGRALISGRWSDVGAFKIPGLRGLAGRAPYFHDGSAGNLDAVVAFYDQRFNLGLSAQEHADLVAFLRAL